MSEDSVSTPIPVAVWGVGRMGSHHARIYGELPGAELVAVVDQVPERAKETADNRGCAACETLEELLERFPGVRALSIATPTTHHLAAAELLLPRRIACLIEKPLASSAAEARRIVELAQAHGTTVQVGHTERFNPAVRAMTDLDIAPRFIQVDRVGPMSFRSIDVGVVFDLMIHDLDIVLMMARSPLRDVRAVGVAVLGRHEDVANARLHFEDGCVANLTASRLALKTDRKLRVFSDAAYVSLDYAKKSGTVISRSANAEELDGLRQRIAGGEDLSSLDFARMVNVQSIDMGDEEPLRAELEHFLEAVAQGSAPAVDAQAGADAVDVAERVVEAIRGHRWRGIDEPRFD